MQIFVDMYLSGKKYSVDVEPSDTIQMVKEKLYQDGFLHNFLDNFFYANQRLENDRTLNYYNIQDGNTVLWILRLRGGN